MRKLNSMKKMIKLTLVLSLFITHSLIYSQSENQTDCSFLKNSKMLNISIPNGGYVIINDSIHTEYVDDGKYYIKSKLEWINDCEYNATVTEFTWPGFNFPIGEILNSKIVKIQNDTLYFELSVRDFKMETKYKRIK